MSSNSTPVFTQQPSNSGQITKNKLCKQKSASFDSSSQNSNYLFNNNQRRLTTNEGTTNKEFIKRRLLVFQEIETYRMRLLEAEEEQQKQIENIKEERIPPTTLLSKGKVIFCNLFKCQYKTIKCLVRKVRKVK
uniref:Uncharacterized protein n=1 Tax=Meloidogyne enterolobii TaxID=390850 RepID=A0A6V7TTI8_MELEN|nr:unnamed protein product [Meloidogyne enterolobii]